MLEYCWLGRNKGERERVRKIIMAPLLDKGVIELRLEVKRLTYTVGRTMDSAATQGQHASSTASS